ncbi:MAG: KAP family NTPase, partial [Prevotella sp.]|nr:KAP family NTPase [Prevotella sp.]
MKKHFKELGKTASPELLIILSVIVAFVAIIMDCLDVPSRLLQKFPEGFRIILLVGIIIVFVCWLIYFNVFDPKKNFAFNKFDAVLTVLLLSNIIYLIAVCIMGLTSGTKCAAAMCTAIVWLIILIVRLAGCCTISRKTNDTGNDKNIFDLKDIYYAESLDVDPDKPIFVKEKEADYDLLNRSLCINQLYLSIVMNRSDISHVIAVEGEWGSGKTTLCTIVKNKIKKNNKDIETIDFDPWPYGSQEAMIREMYDIILDKIGIRHNTAEYRHMIQFISSMVSCISDVGGRVLESTYQGSGLFSSLSGAKKKIDKLLQRSNKRFVIFIDNLDRADSDNIILLFKVLGTVFDLPGVVYVLMYDRERINHILMNEDKINSKYSEKIIQQEMHVPSIATETLKNIYDVCLSRILSAYGVVDLSEYKNVYDLICEQVLDLRTFKRLINSAFSTALMGNTQLNREELLIMEIIRFLEVGLYVKIRDNERFFVSHDKMTDWERYFHSKEFNSEGKAFFDDLSAEYSAYLPILSDIFPYVKRYKHGDNLEYKNGGGFDKITSDCPICSAKYFDLYFSQGNNNFTDIGSKVTDFISFVNHSDGLEEITDYLKKVFIDLVDEEDHKEWIAQFRNNIDDIMPEDRCSVAIAFMENEINID